MKKQQRPNNSTDKEALTYFVSLQGCYINPEQMHTVRGKEIANDIEAKFEGYKRWAYSQINQLKK